MTIRTNLQKRPALYKGEVGFFPGDPLAGEDIEQVAMYALTMHDIRSERNIKALRYLWAVVHKTHDNCDLFRDKDDAMEKLKIRVGFSKMVWNARKRRMEEVAKSLTRISDEELRSLTQRILDVICVEVLPGMKSEDLRREVEEYMEGRA